jgi:hypothetical protein
MENSMSIIETGPHRQYTFETTGQIVYDPKRGSMKNNTDWWCIIQMCPGLMEYYRAQMLKRYHLQLHQPAHGSHMSIIRGEVNSRVKSNWKHLDRKKVCVKYTHEIFWNEDHAWVNAYCDEFYEIRQRMGLPVSFGAHITIGKFADHHRGALGINTGNTKHSPAA